jgi:hypothetical protein
VGINSDQKLPPPSSSSAETSNKNLGQEEQPACHPPSPHDASLLTTAITGTPVLQSYLPQQRQQQEMHHPHETTYPRTPTRRIATTTTSADEESSPSAASSSSPPIQDWFSSIENFFRTKKG